MYAGVDADKRHFRHAYVTLSTPAPTHARLTENSYQAGQSVCANTHTGSCAGYTCRLGLASKTGARKPAGEDCDGLTPPLQDALMTVLAD